MKLNLPGCFRRPAGRGWIFSPSCCTCLSSPVSYHNTHTETQTKVFCLKEKRKQTLSTFSFHFSSCERALEDLLSFSLVHACSQRKKNKRLPLIDSNDSTRKSSDLPFPFLYNPTRPVNSINQDALTAPSQCKNSSKAAKAHHSLSSSYPHCLPHHIKDRRRSRTNSTS